MHRGGWPNAWMTAEQIVEELDHRGFWSGHRRLVMPQARTRLMQHFLDQLIEEGLTKAGDEGGWKRFDGQYKRNPKTKLIDYRAQTMGRTYDRRSWQRRRVEGVRCQYGPVINLSAQGMMFTSEDRLDLQPNQRGFLRITFGKKSVRVRAKIVWTSPGPKGVEVGCDFRRLTPQDVLTLQDITAEAAVDE